ncbi:MAG TPA: hypothetical protein VNY84_15655, partial [Acidimicrobiales bacterium]|nr:hypothetical protein [Acidimicrobiales bacterium]
MGSLDWADVLADEPVPPPPRSMHELLEQTRRRGQERLGRRNRRRRGVLTALAVASIVTPLLVLVGDSSTRVSTRVARLPSVTIPAPIAPGPADNGLARSAEPGGPAASGTGQLPIDGLGAGSPASVPSVLGNATGPPNPGPAGPSSDPLTALPAVAFMRQSCPGGQEQSQLLLRRPSGATNAMPPAPDRRSTQASWSPDGHRVVFASQRNNLIWVSHSVWDLYVMNADGSGLRQITFSPQNPADQLTGTSSPAWSSDGWIYYTQATTGKAPLRAIRPDGSGDRVVLASPTADYFNPTVSPDGTEIAVDEVARPSDNTIVVINPSGKVLFRL